jgi:hypothetical protein
MDIRNKNDHTLKNCNIVSKGLFHLFVLNIHNTLDPFQGYNYFPNFLNKYNNDQYILDPRIFVYFYKIYKMGPYWTVELHLRMPLPRPAGFIPSIKLKRCCPLLGPEASGLIPTLTILRNCVPVFLCFVYK